MLTRIVIPSSVDQTDPPPEIATLINAARARIEAFQDRWDRPQIEQFVAADYLLVFQSLAWTLQTQPLLGKRFLEWGCGFAVVSAIAAHLGLDVIGIEAEEELIDQGKVTIERCNVPAQLVHGNFLPPGAASLADQSELPSLGHEAPCAYRRLDLDLDDFAIVYDYPWPGEEGFHEQVFDQYAAAGAMLMLFCGPNDIRLWRKAT